MSAPSRKWWAAGVAGVAAGPLVVVGLVLLLVSAWVPVAAEEAERRDQAQHQAAEAGDGGGVKGENVPEEYQQALTEWGTHCPTLTPARLAAQLQVESGWDPSAHNTDSGAQGLAQFMPGTWQEYGTDGNGDGTANVWEPLDAIATAAVYNCAVAEMVEGIDGDPVDLMLAGYNAGPGAVQHAGGVPNYRETVDYIAKIRELETQMARDSGSHQDEKPASGEGARILATARQQIGTPYVWGGGDTTGPTHGGFDCSGLTQYAVYEGTGGRVSLPRTSNQQRTIGQGIERADIRPGDLIVINHDGAWGHVGVYAGDGRMVHAPRTGRDVVEDDVFTGYWADFDMDIRRVT